VVTAFGLSAIAFALAAHILIAGRLWIPLVNFAFFEACLPRWASVASLILLGLLWLLVAFGGLIALHEDANEAREQAANDERR
jgi:hypothetical protein